MVTSLLKAQHAYGFLLPIARSRTKRNDSFNLSHKP